MSRFIWPKKLQPCNLARRDWLWLSTLATISCLQRQTRGENLARPRGFGRAKSVILVFTNGGQSQIDMWDPKPNAPLDVRGEFQAISTGVPGIQVGEHLAKVSRVLDRCTIVRSMSHQDIDHGSAVYLSLTGHYHARRSSNPPPRPTDAPTLAAVMRRVRPMNSFFCDALHLNGPVLAPSEPSAGQYGGILGRAFEPMLVSGDTDSPNPLGALQTKRELPNGRLSERLRLKQALDGSSSDLNISTSAVDMDRWYSQALDLLATPKAREAFDVQSEPVSVRQRYGEHRSGQAMLQARRLVEAGVPFVNVIWNHCSRGQDFSPDDTDEYGWDTHNDIFGTLRERLIPRFDQSFSALIEDLDQRQLLEQTLVVCMGEFGRAPRVAKEPGFPGFAPGRKHWASVYSIVMAGAGVQRGAVVGASDRLGAEPITARYGPWDVAATMFNALGIPHSDMYLDLEARPQRISDGSPIEEVYGT